MKSFLGRLSLTETFPMSSKSFYFSQRAKRTHEHPISYLMAEAVANPDLISLAAGLVDYQTLPSEEILELSKEIFSGGQRSAKNPLQYGVTPGLRELREILLDHMASSDGMTPAELSASVENMIITTGSQQLLFILTDLLVDPGDIVIAAWPSYFVYTGALETLGAEVYGVKIDQDGMIPESLRETLEQIKAEGKLSKVKILYVVDYHQNPTGITLSEQRRPELLEIVKEYSTEHKILLIEDSAYRELTYEGEPPSSIKKFDTNNEYVALVQTFSKTFSPGIKIGYGLLPDELSEPAMLQKGNHDFGSSNFGQTFIYEAFRRGLYKPHVELLKKRYTEKRDVLLNSLEEHFGDIEGVTWTHPSGGLYVWLTFPTHIDTHFEAALFQEAKKAGVIYVPGGFCYAQDRRQEIPMYEARLSYGAVEDEKIVEGVRRLSQAFQSVNKG